MEWLDIETAPKNCELLLYAPPVLRARPPYDQTHPEHVYVGFADGTPFRPPTHWMPLPHPPKEQP